MLGAGAGAKLTVGVGAVPWPGPAGGEFGAGVRINPINWSTPKQIAEMTLSLLIDVV